jgi:hypothetical protein
MLPRKFATFLAGDTAFYSFVHNVTEKSMEKSQVALSYCLCWV